MDVGSALESLGGTRTVGKRGGEIGGETETGGGERERERRRNRDRQREREKERERQKEREYEKERESVCVCEKQRERERDRDRQTKCQRNSGDLGVISKVPTSMLKIQLQKHNATRYCALERVFNKQCVGYPLKSHEVQ